MHWIDLSIFIIYMLVMLGVGFFFLRKNKGADDYYVGGRSMNSFHIGLSVVATDVGGGFSIGLGGLGNWYFRFVDVVYRINRCMVKCCFPYS